jgi:hypothetical protein
MGAPCIFLQVATRCKKKQEFTNGKCVKGLR